MQPWVRGWRTWKGGITVNKGVGQARAQLLPKVLSKTQQVLFVPWTSCGEALIIVFRLKVKTRQTDTLFLNFHSMSLLLSVSSFGSSASFSGTRLAGKVAGKHDCVIILAFMYSSHRVPHAGKMSGILTLSFFHFVSNGSRDEPESGAHALCHRLWFLWQPENQWHVLCMLQGTPDTTAEQ